MRKGLFTIIIMLCTVCARAENVQERVLVLDEYVMKATTNDTEFQEILIDSLPLQYRRDLNLPAKDIVLEVATQYDLFLIQDREEQEGSLSLTKLFPMTGTEIDLGYSTSASFSRSTNKSDFTLSITQPIAENAFGKATRLKNKIIGVEIDVIKHQVVEAYEDYL